MGFLVGLLMHVTQEKDYFFFTHEGHIEALLWLRSTDIFCIGEIPEDLQLLALDIKALGSLLLPKEPWLHVHFAHIVATWVIHMDTESLAHEVLAPCDCHKSADSC